MKTSKGHFGFILLAALFLLTTACKKDSDKNSPSNLAEGTMTYKSNGKLISYNSCFAVDEVDDTAHTITVMGYALSDVGKFIMLGVGSDHDIKSGLTVDQNTSDVGEIWDAGLIYVEDSTEYADDNGLTSQFKISIVERTATNIKGTFSGKLYDEDPNNTRVFDITEGAFNAPVTKQ